MNSVSKLVWVAVWIGLGFHGVLGASEKTDSLKTLENLSLYREYVKQDNIPDAIKPWRWLFIHSPGAKEYVYVDGASKILPYMIQQAKSESQKQKLIDTLMMVFDERIRYFGNEGKVLGRKGFAMLQYRAQERAQILETFSRCVELEGKETEYFVLQPYFRLLLDAHKNGEVSKDKVMKTYLKVNQICGQNAQDKYADQYAQQSAAIDIMVGEIISNCQEVQELYMPIYSKDPENVQIQDAMYAIMSAKNCYEAPVFAEVAEKKFVREKSSAMAVQLARSYTQAKRYEDAQNMYLKAVNIEEDGDKKAQYMVEMAEMLYRYPKNYSEAKTALIKASGMKNDWGKPWIVMGDLYVSASGTCTEKIDKWAAYWAAIDKYQKAAAVDPSFKAESAERVRNLNGYLPEKSEVFFYNLTAGQSYSSGCWIGETTTVRVR